MALGWLGALKLVPWSEVIEAAPMLVKGARRVFARSQEVPLEDPSATPAAGSDALAVLQERMTQLEARAAALAQQQEAAAELIETLAEHNARLIEAVERLRRRQRWLAGALALLAAAGLALRFWN